MLAACCPLVSTMVDVKAVNSMKESQRLWLQVIDSSEESWTAALKGSALRKREQQQLGLEEWSTLWQRVDSGSWIRGVIDSLVESRHRFLSKNLMIADTLRPSSMLNIGL